MFVLSMILCVICFFDYYSKRIPNLLILLILLWGMGRGVYQKSLCGAGEYLMILAAVVFLLYPIFQIGGLGAGDVKLLCTCAGFFPVDKVISFLFMSLLISAVFSIVKLVKERNLQDRIAYFLKYVKSVVKNGKWSQYLPQKDLKKLSGICMSGPILCSVLLGLGGVY